MNLTKQHLALIGKIEQLTGLKLEARALNRSTFLVQLPVGERTSESKFEVQIRQICNTYKLARVETNGINELALIV